MPLRTWRRFLQQFKRFVVSGKVRTSCRTEILSLCLHSPEHRKQLNNGNEPFALTIGGSKIYVITKSEDVAEAYRNIETLSFNQFVQAMMRACGNTESCVQAMYTPLPKDKEGFPNPHEKPLATLARGMYIH